MDLRELPRFDAAALLREICQHVRRLLAQHPDDHVLAHRVAVAYEDLRKRLRELEGTELLVESLGDPCLPDRSEGEGSVATGFDQRHAVPCP